MRSLLRTSIATLSILLFASINCHSTAAKRITIGELKCENLISPLAIDNTSPHFSWKMYSEENNVSITAYQVLVASELSKLTEGKTDLWDSGVVKSTESIGIKYEGKQLSSRQSGYWKVRVWDQSGKASKWSEPASFGVGLLAESGNDIVCVNA